MTSVPTTPRVELLWFSECPSHSQARKLLLAVLDARGLERVAVSDIDATDPSVAEAHRFPGSPTIRVDGMDIEPEFMDPGEYTPRCRIYWTERGPSGIPERTWIEAAIDAAMGE